MSFLLPTLHGSIPATHARMKLCDLAEMCKGTGMANAERAVEINHAIWRSSHSSHSGPVDPEAGVGIRDPFRSLPHRGAGAP